MLPQRLPTCTSYVRFAAREVRDMEVVLIFCITTHADCGEVILYRNLKDEALHGVGNCHDTTAEEVVIELTARFVTTEHGSVVTFTVAEYPFVIPLVQNASTLKLYFCFADNPVAW